MLILYHECETGDNCRTKGIRLRIDHVVLLRQSEWRNRRLTTTRSARSSFRRIIIEEAIRLMTLEVVIGLPPIGIAEAMGADQQLMNVVAAISLPVPLIISVLLVVARTRRRQEQTQELKPWLPSKRVWIGLGLAALAAILLALLVTERGLMSRMQVIAVILTTLLWIGGGMVVYPQMPALMQSPLCAV
jgi:small-conductance mechanosensitive channel